MNIGLVVAMVARIIMVVAGLKLIELTDPAWPDGPDWFTYSWRDPPCSREDSS